MLLEDTEDHTIDYQPAIFPQEREEALNLVQRDNLGEQGHNPILTEDEDFHLFICKVLRQVGQFVVDQRFDHFTMLVKAGKAAHVYFFQMIVV